MISALNKYNMTLAIMKGIAIVSVVAGHCTMYKVVENYVNQYHLAVFFFVAGYFLTDKYVNSPILLIKKRFKTLYVPFILSGLAFLLLHNVLANIYINDQSLSLSQMFVGGQNLVFKLFSTEPLMGAMWFCPVLLFASIISVIVLAIGRKIGRENDVPIFCLMIMTVFCGSFSLKILCLKSPYCIWQNMIISGILFEGWLFRKYFERFVPSNKMIMLLLFLIMSIIIGVNVKFGTLCNLQVDNVNIVPAWALLVAAFVGCIMVYSLSALFIDTKMGHILSVIGNHSFSIMMFHFLAFKLVNLIICLVDGFPLTQISNFPTIQYGNIIWFFAYIFVGCSFPIVIVKIKNIILKKHEF